REPVAWGQWRYLLGDGHGTEFFAGGCRAEFFASLAQGRLNPPNATVGLRMFGKSRDDGFLFHGHVTPPAA
ncbi:hypothetical protein, partial [Klebsiella pneumoniae]|uniref:hypothetical protein n=1 Tax=Klebsiella pneumoniae TaxID=573 RepID=UPI001952F80C